MIGFAEIEYLRFRVGLVSCGWLMDNAAGAYDGASRIVAPACILSIDRIWS